MLTWSFVHLQNLSLEERVIVAAVCEICGKSPGFGMNVSHSHRRTKRRWDPNIQRVRALVNGTPTHLNVCTSCISAGRVVKPPRRIIADHPA
jgi:large subunit ribosomal protein L28